MANKKCASEPSPSVERYQTLHEAPWKRAFRGGLVLASFAAIMFGAGALASSQPSGHPTAGSIQAQAPPKTLTDSAEYAENIYDLAQSANWKEVESRRALLERSAAGYPATAPTLRDLGTAIQQRKQLLAMKISNEITREAAELMRQYKTPAPVEIALLDYEGRKLQVAAKENDTSALQQAVQDSRRIWNLVRPEVERHGGSSEARDFDSLMSQLSSARTAQEFQQLATNILSQVDKLEVVFTRNPR